MFYLICFDIVDDKKRYRAVKILKKYSVRVQKSVFEAYDLDDYKLQKLRSKLSEVIDHSSDSIRYYPLCRACRTYIKQEGIGPEPVRVPWVVV
ncbi:MAG: CRISPR-associated endonuclease Cas2 [Desulforegulaceae bacterium]|nr:CRISPR-associated endonuclease Cas2 [Desulforegulaceae bacterium]